MIGRLLQAADFKRLMSVAPSFRSAHFAVHHLVESPAKSRFVHGKRELSELSTVHQDTFPQPVESSRESPQGETPQEGFPRWLGCVIPKRHARRAVTRNLIRRQIYAAAGRAQAGLPEGMWLVRLRQDFAPAQYPSAASDALRASVRSELDRLFSKASHRADTTSVDRLKRTGHRFIRSPIERSEPGAGAA